MTINATDPPSTDNKKSTNIPSDAPQHPARPQNPDSSMMDQEQLNNNVKLSGADLIGGTNISVSSNKVDDTLAHQFMQLLKGNSLQSIALKITLAAVVVVPIVALTYPVGLFALPALVVAGFAFISDSTPVKNQQPTNGATNDTSSTNNDGLPQNHATNTDGPVHEGGGLDYCGNLNDYYPNDE